MTKIIKKDKIYSLQDIVRDRMFPWAHSFWTARNVIEMDRKGGNILKALITGKNRGTKYHIKGENIINFISKVEMGEVRL